MSPLPVPGTNEEKDKFISRCISEIQGEFKDNTQRIAVCYSQWRKAKGEKLGENSMKDLKVALFDDNISYEAYSSPASSGATTCPKVWRKEILLFGKWRHPEDKNIEFEITPKIADQILKNFYSGIPAEAPVILTHTDNPMMKVGTVKFFIKTESGIDAILAITDDSTLKKIISPNEVPGVSCWIDLSYEDKQSGKNIGAVIKHVAFVNHPYIEGMKGFEAVFSEGEERINYIPLILSENNFKLGDAPMTREEAISFLKGDGIDVVSLQEESKSFQERIDSGELVIKSDVFSLNDEVKARLKGFGLSDEDFVDPGKVISKIIDLLKTKGDKAAELQAVLSDFEAERDIGGLIAGGFVFPAEKDFLKKLKKSDATMFSDFVENRKKVGKVVELSEKGKTVSQESTIDTEKEKKNKDEIARQEKLAKSEGFIR